MSLRPLSRDQLPAELHAAYDDQRQALLRRRMLWVLGVFLFSQIASAGMLAISTFQSGPVAAFGQPGPHVEGTRYWLLLGAMIAFAVTGFVAVWQRWKKLPDWPTSMALSVAAPSWISLAGCLSGLNLPWFDVQPWEVGTLAALVYPWTVRDSVRAGVLVLAGALPAAVLFAITDRGMEFTQSRAMAAIMMPVAALCMIAITAVIRRPRQRELVIDVLATAITRQELPRSDRWPCGQAAAGDYIRAAEMRAAYAMESARLFRRSLMRFLAGAGALCVALAVGRLASLKLVPPGQPLRDVILDPLSLGLPHMRAMISTAVPFNLALGTGLLATCVMLLWTRSTRTTLRLSSSVIIALAYCTLALEAVRLVQSVQMGQTMLRPDAELPLFTCAVSLGLWTLLGSILLPWTVGDALRTVALSVLAGGMVMYVSGMLSGINVRWQAYVLSPLSATVFSIPAVVGAALRQSFWHQQFQGQYVEKRERDLREELTYARKLHESLFPTPIADGPLRLAFRYEPMREIGGDFLFVHDARSHHADPSVSVVVIDVTGHGIPAAITVAQLAGELRRIYAERPDAPPEHVLGALNKYVLLTVASLSVYATAICARVNPRLGTVRYASAGHPPLFLRRVGGQIEDLDSTTFVLGVAGGADFESDAIDVPFAPGDALVVFTDGAAEARDGDGRMLRVSGVRSLVRRAMVGPHLLPEWLLQAVRLHRVGPPEDDTLVAVVFRTPEAAQVEAAAPTAPTAPDPVSP